MSDGRKTIHRFSWVAVGDPLLRDLMRATWPGDAEEIARLSTSTLQQWCRETFGTDPRMSDEPMEKEAVDVLRRKWLPRASALEIEAAVTLLERQQGAAPTSRRERVQWIQQRRATVNLRWVLTRAFCNAHRTDVPVRSRTGQRVQGARVRDLDGKATSERPLMDHQRCAQQALDGAFEHRDRSALVVMPTGSGKTHTLVSWLLDRLDDDPALRVLWLAHRRELVDQAAAAFEVAARSKPRGFHRLLRAVHGGAAELNALADRNEPVDVAVATVQSFTMSRHASATLKSFYSRPVITVLDEAHHAGADRTDELLRSVARRKNHSGLIGLTATPFPTSLVSHERFRKHFPQTTFEAEAPPLIRKRVLARPITSVVDTGHTYRLGVDVVAKLERGSEPGNAYDVLDEPSRNRLLAEICRRQREIHGPTLLFTLSIDHAEAMVELLVELGVAAKAIHSRSTMSMTDARKWFDTAEDPVLVSVGMLNEGVDLPRARTAILGRPTISRILMQQMVGRVLRGPLAGGDTDAFIVYLNDQFSNFSDLLDPAEVLDQYEPRRRRGLVEESTTDLPEIKSDDGRRIPYGVAGHLGRMMTQSVFGGDTDDDEPTNDRPLDVSLSTSALIGYYDLPTTVVPVLDHQRTVWEQLIAAASDGRTQKWQAYFNDEPPPAPSARAVRDMVRYVQLNGSPPPFIDVEATIGPSRCADAILAAGALTEIERIDLIQHHHSTTVNAETYLTMDFFEEAVENELRDRRRSERLRDVLPASPLGRRPTRRPAFVDTRPLRPLLQQTAQRGRDLLPAELRSLVQSMPEHVGWSPRPIRNLLGYWNVSTHGRNRGRRKIVLSSAYRTTPDVVTDEMLRYLLWHELLHDLLPGQQHDAQFRELEHQWPKAVELDASWNTLHDRYRFPQDSD